MLRFALGALAISIGGVVLVFIVCDFILKGLDALVVAGTVAGILSINIGLLLLDFRVLPQYADRNLSGSKKTWIMVVALLVAFGLGELVVRFGPYERFVTSLQEILDVYQASSSSYLMYDPQLGWSPRPGGRSADGLYQANGAGLRSDVEYDPDPALDTLRIAVFGDSFTHGDDVSLVDTWAYQLEALLTGRGVRAEVLNFGVGGYGIDQAFIRWQEHGKLFQPDIVVFGFQPENVLRNLNLFRHFYDKSSGLPFFKPRFILQDGQLRLVNSPTPPPEAVLDAIAHFDQSPLAAYEYFYDPEDRSDFRLPSKFLFLIYSSILRLQAGPHNYAAFFSEDSEAGQLALAIVQAFSADVVAGSARFIVLHLPLRSDLDQFVSGRSFTHAALLEQLAGQVEVIRLETAFDRDRLDDYFVNGALGGHYSRAGNEQVAIQLVNAIGRHSDDGDPAG